jgi:hypothetical protein
MMNRHRNWLLKTFGAGAGLALFFEAVLLMTVISHVIAYLGALS